MTIMRDLALSKMNILFAPPPKDLPSPSASPNVNEVEKKKTEAEQIKELTEKVFSKKREKRGV